MLVPKIHFQNYAIFYCIIAHYLFSLHFMQTIYICLFVFVIRVHEHLAKYVSMIRVHEHLAKSIVDDTEIVNKLVTRMI